MSNEYSKITLNQLDKDAIAEYVVLSKKLVYRDGDMDTAANTSLDTDKVAGVSSDNIAVAIDKDHRDTVQNALQLGGLDASEYMTNTAGSGIQETQNKATAAFGGDIRDLKDELYQLRHELSKNGIIEDLGQYTGYHDNFRNNRYINVQDMVGIASTVETDKENEIIVNDNEVFNSFDALDFICIVNNNNKTFDIKQIAEKEAARNAFVLDSNLRSIVRDSELSLYKSKGIIHNGLYKFANEAATIISTEEYHSGLSDDTYNTTKRINTSQRGFGYGFKVPESKQGFVTSLEICAKAFGSPGALMCYLIDARDLDKFRNPTQAENDYESDKENNSIDGFKFFAKSQPYTLNSSMGKRYIKFNFQQSDGSYPLMTQDKDGEAVRYIVIIEALDVDKDNYYDIIFLQHRNQDGSLSDLELNNVTYHYRRQSDSSADNALTTDADINNFDMYYNIVTRGTIENEPEAQKQGLYTAQYTQQNAKTDFYAAKARLMLRVKREGEYRAVVDSDLPKVFDNDVLTVENENAANNIKTIEDLRLKTELYKRIEERKSEADISEQVNVIIGNNIVKVKGLDLDTITTASPILVKNHDKIYRSAYLVSLKAREIKFDKETGEYAIGDYDHYIMPLKDVFKDLNPVNTDYSDRLLFECDLDADKKYNDFEIQIFWENPELSNYTDIKASQMGAIKDLVWSFVRGF